jgi:glycosyltransferase involved in cell wall biosynthesis
MPERKKRILFVSSQNISKSNGGLESATQIFEALREEFEWILVVPRHSAFSRRWTAGGARIEIVPFEIRQGGLAQIFSLGRLIWFLTGVIVKHRPHIVHANDSFMCKHLLKLRRLTKADFLLTVRGTQNPGKVYGRHWRKSAETCRQIVVLSDEMAEQLAVRIGVTKERFAVVNSIVDLHRFRPRVEKVRSGPIKIGHVGVFEPNKGQLGLIERTGPILLGDEGNYRLHFAGDFEPEKDAYAKRCQAAVERLGLGEFVTFHGFCEEAASLYRAWDVVVVTSGREGLARAMIEAMASGLPVVSFDVCSAREMLHDTGAGIVVPQGDYMRLAEELRRIGQDPVLRREMGDRGRRVAEQRFGRDRVRQAWLELYTRCGVGASPAPLGLCRGRSREADGDGNRHL